ncbi:MAG: AMP-binding protein, partial [Clostridia bacterium]|nr:AMP-binding protein [Clostridia bacterium]
KSVTYRRLKDEIGRCADALRAVGVKENDRVTIALPNCPQAIYLFYAVNRVGAVANMIHPLSAEKEIEFYLNASKSRVAVTLDSFYGKFARVLPETAVTTLIIASVGDALSPIKKIGYALTEKRKFPAVPKDAPAVLLWKDFLKRRNGEGGPYPKRAFEDPAVILYSGGTTGTTKGIVLTNQNFGALGEQVVAANPFFRPGDKMLSAMPLFHGFGLGVCIHTMLAHGGRCVLIPRFTAASYAKDLVKHRCNLIAGVPTLYEALLRLPGMEKADLSCLKGVYCGGDSLTVELKKKFDRFLESHGSSVQIREGYGTTETVTACCLTPLSKAKEGSIGIPFPDTFVKIVKPGTDEELPYGEEGEILLAGPTVMKEYMDQPEETAETLRTHADGLTWVYTGDLGTMDSDGFIYFRGRAKRMIVSSGYNIYPSQLENILDAHEKVQMSCVIGIPDPYRMQKVKAFVKLVPGVPATEETRNELMEYCRQRIAKYAMPCGIEFREDMPKTLVGKVAYRVLEEEENEKIKRAEQTGS